MKEFYNENLEGQYCKKTSYGGYSHQHVVYTEGFIDAYKNVFPDKINVQNVKTLAASHHNPSTYEE